MTPRVLAREFEAARLKSIDEYRKGVTVAWNMARFNALTKSKKGLKPLKDYLHEVDDTKAAKSERQSATQLRTALGMLSELGWVGRGRKGT